jgi:pimeloyl-ACP methyl ester carboxylesterase
MTVRKPMMQGLNVFLLLLITACTKSTETEPQSIFVNGVEISYIEQGSGDEVFIFVHGYSGSLGNWEWVLERLPKQYHAYALDQRGFGKSGRPGSYELTDFVEDIYAFSQELGIEQFTYVGHSLGGKIGYKFALDHPDVLKAMVLAEPSPAGVMVPPEELPAVKDMITSAWGSPDALRDFMLQSRKPPSEDILNEFIVDAEVADPTAKAQVIDFWFFADLETQLGDIGVPTLILAGAQDDIPLDMQTRYASAIKGCRFEVWEDYGHYIPQESPQEFVDLLTSFVEDVSQE